MSIASQIERLQIAKADIKTSIENKGVTVPSNASIGTYYSYIDQIPSGGGGGTNYLEQYANRSLSGAITSAQLGTNIGANMVNNLLNDQTNITSVDLTGTGATRIANGFCQHSWNLVGVTVPNTVTEIGNNFCQDTNLASFTIPSSVTKIGEYFLRDSNSITSITVPSTVTSLGSDAFNNCRNLTTLIFNAPISNPNQALCICTDSLALVDLNSSVTNIRSYCFSRNSASTNLLEVVLRRTDGIVTVANRIGNTNYNAAFSNRQNIKLYVPSALIASYEANANWAAGITKGYLTIVALEGSQYE